MMRITKLTAFAALSLAFCLLTAGNLRAEGIRFEKGALDGAKAKARESGRLIFVDAYTTWCGPCKYMSANVFTQDEAGAYFNRHFVNIKLDMEKGEGKAFAKQYKVRSYPTLLFIDADGKVVHRAVGARDAEALVKLGRMANDPEQNLAGARKRFEAAPNDPKAAYAYAMASDEAGSGDRNAAETYRGAVSGDDWFTAGNWRFIQAYAGELDDPLFELAAKNRARFETVAEDKEEVGQFLEGVSLQELMRARLAPIDGDRAQEIADADARIRKLLGEDAEGPVAAANFYALQRQEEKPADKDAYAVAAAYLQYYDSPMAKNEAAWYIYENCEDKDCARGAAEWARQAAEAEPDPAILDTYMRLALKAGNLKQAKKAGKKCLKLSKKAGDDAMVKDTEAFLEEVKAAR